MTENNQQNQNFNLNTDTTPVLFADSVSWNITRAGIVLSFGQTAAIGLKRSSVVKIVSRIGLSRDFTKDFLQAFGKNLALTEAQGQTGKVKS